MNRLISWFKPPRPPTQKEAERKLRGLLARSYRQSIYALRIMLKGVECPPVRATDKLVKSPLLAHIDPRMREAAAWLHREFHLWQGDMPGGWVYAPLTAAKAYIRINQALAVMRAGLERLGVQCKEKLPEFPFVMKDRVRWASYSASLETREELAGFLDASSADTD